MYYVVVIWHIGPHGDGPWPSGVGTKISNHCQVQKLILRHWYLLRLFTAMPSAKGPLWNHFWQGKKQNESQYRAHCHGCIEKMCPKEAVIEYSEEAQLMELLADEEADENPIPDDGELEGSGDDFEY